MKLLRDTTERPVTVRLGTNTLLGLDPTAISRVSLDPPNRPSAIPAWDGRAAERVAATVIAFLDRDRQPHGTPPLRAG